MREDGYELFRRLNEDGEATYRHDTKDYQLCWFGERTEAGNGLRVTCEQTGQVRKFRGGYSSESTWNLMATLESDRWDSPIGEWQGPERWTN